MAYSGSGIFLGRNDLASVHDAHLHATLLLANVIGNDVEDVHLRQGASVHAGYPHLNVTIMGTAGMIQPPERAIAALEAHQDALRFTYEFLGPNEHEEKIRETYNVPAPYSVAQNHERARNYDISGIVEQMLHSLFEPYTRTDESPAEAIGTEPPEELAEMVKNTNVPVRRDLQYLLAGD